ncbi:hypothetical protein [Streptomyces sp. MBT53]|uniref:hypothetical protein n=1 Tax=Streptomyces sp. MBT53 TaxID=1488384 RepID=UPI001913130B|nr:hypothetical protein [Streptomyces sp. MBT53]MBK6011791.1 hypothetical protein [Streptomyces sp. MBT53]
MDEHGPVPPLSPLVLNGLGFGLVVGAATLSLAADRIASQLAGAGFSPAEQSTAIACLAAAAVCAVFIGFRRPAHRPAEALAGH